MEKGFSLYLQISTVLLKFYFLLKVYLLLVSLTLTLCWKILVFKSTICIWTKYTLTIELDIRKKCFFLIHGSHIVKKEIQVTNLDLTQIGTN